MKELDLNLVTTFLDLNLFETFLDLNLWSKHIDFFVEQLVEKKNNFSNQ
jgi:hypothetical protein